MVSNLLAHPTIQRVCRLCDSLWALLSMAIVPMLVGGTLALHLQQPAVVSLNTKGTITVVAPAATDIRIESPVGIHVDAATVVYRPYIKDSSGRLIYELKEKVSKSQVNTQFDIPGLPSGTYFLHTYVLYPLNPLKTVEVKVNVARIEVF